MKLIDLGLYPVRILTGFLAVIVALAIMPIFFFTQDVTVFDQIVNFMINKK